VAGDEVVEDAGFEVVFLKCKPSYAVPLPMCFFVFFHCEKIQKGEKNGTEHSTQMCAKQFSKYVDITIALQYLKVQRSLRVIIFQK
jgi:hypothetical protein